MTTAAEADVRLVELTTADEPCLRALMQLYAYDFSELLDLDVEEDGNFVVPAVDGYFSDPRRHGFLLRVQGKLAGFALVSEGSRLAEDDDVYDMAEFFVMRRHRARGVGRAAASALFARFPGPWEVRQRAANHAATAFWLRTIAFFTGGLFEDREVDDERWCGRVQRFDSSAGQG